MQKQVNLGDVVKADFNGTESDGVVTWISSCAKVVIFQQQDTGHLFWTDVDNLIEVNTEENFMQLSQEQVFNLGDEVVVPTPYGFRAGVVESVDYYADEDSFYYEVDVYTLQDSADYKAEDIYDLEGLEWFIDKQQDENIKVIDEVSMGVYLVIDDYNNVYELAEHHLAEKRSAEVEKQDSIIEELRDLLKQRSETGIHKYGTTLDRTDLSSSEWCQHLLEELLDATGYVLRLKKDLEAVNGVSIRVNGIA